ncbi:Putative Mitochondrial precursor of Dihydroorotate dehydrogenase [Podospora comata]|uniref:Dihydroorotate dehydrogenase (quinone), mitochondrial n=1 Tax=Podospora comata TaxID=48703 RepID=A0ABY6SHQ5_PODCO|nr:Putative Mitochondrial precursor of Dihydroorotate dehydrogenase [Podospora comata]
MASPFLRTRHTLSSALRPFARNPTPRINHAVPRRPASTASSSSGGSSAKTVAISTALGTAAVLGYYYATDTRASLHKYLVPRVIRVLFPDAEDAHHAGTAALKALYSVGLHPRERVQDGDATGAKPLAVNVFGVELSNPIGISAGLDKDAEIPDPLFALGAGVVEVGGITPLPQEGNPKPRVFRVVSTDGLINRYGLNSKGADAVAAHLRERLRTFARSIGFTEKEMLDGEAGVPVGSLKDGRLLCVQIAKNKKTDEKDVEAVKKDYVTCVNRLAPYADVLVVNVSSPNTPGLRDLQATGPLTALLSAVVEEAQKTKRKVKPRVMVKVSPDEDDDSQMEGVVQAVWMSGVDGVIVGNTTKKRTGLVPKGVRLTSQEQKNIMEDGGYSGPALFNQTLNLVGRYRKMLDSYSLKTEGLGDAFNKNQKVIFATGGITNGDEALKVLNAGASVAMVYTGMVYGGSGTITRIKNEMREKLAIEDKKQ